MRVAFIIAQLALVLLQISIQLISIRWKNDAKSVKIKSFRLNKAQTPLYYLKCVYLIPFFPQHRAKDESRSQKYQRKFLMLVTERCVSIKSCSETSHVALVLDMENLWAKPNQIQTKNSFAQHFHYFLMASWAILRHLKLSMTILGPKRSSWSAKGHPRYRHFRSQSPNHTIVHSLIDIAIH